MNLFRPEVVAMQPYTLRDTVCSVKVNQNESPWDWPEALKQEALREAMAVPFNRYPPFEEGRLTAALAERWGLDPASVLVANGSNELLQAVFLAALGPGRRLLLPKPTFSLYRQLARLSGCDLQEVLLEEGVSYDAEAWFQAARRRRPEALLICSPNNPTGAAFPEAALDLLLDLCPGLVVVDEAYGEFSGTSAARFLPGRENLVVLRTFSKAWGGAALRLGYLLAAPSAASQVKKALLPYTLSPLTAAIGLVALRRSDLFERRVRELLAERERLGSALSALPGARVYPSEANFILVRLTGVSASLVHEGLMARDVLVRDVSMLPGLSECLRVSVGSREENDRIVRGFREVLG